MRAVSISHRPSWFIRLAIPIIPARTDASGGSSTDNAQDSVVNGVGVTARVITAAAAIMISAFGGFMFGDDVTVKMIGLGLASAVLIDATLVRMVLVPSTMVMFDKANWWLPTWLDRLLPGRTPTTQVPAARSPSRPSRRGAVTHPRRYRRGHANHQRRPGRGRRHPAVGGTTHDHGRGPPSVTSGGGGSRSGRWPCAVFTRDVVRWGTPGNTHLLTAVIEASAHRTLAASSACVCQRHGTQSVDAAQTRGGDVVVHLHSVAQLPAGVVPLQHLLADRHRVRL